MTQLVKLTKFHILIFLSVLFLLTRFTIDPDLGWHIALGRYLLEGRFLSQDIFSWTMPGFFWANPYVLYQMIVTFLMDNFGLLLTGLVFGLIGAFSVLLLLPGKVNFWGGVVAVIAAGMLTTSLGIRPHVFDLLFFALLLRFLDLGFHKKLKFCLVAFSGFALWANLHPGFLVGLIFLAAFMVLDLLLTRSFKKKEFLRVVVIFAASMLGTLVTPFGVWMWIALLRDSGGILGWLNILEYQPTGIFTPLNAFFAFSALVHFILLRKQLNQPAWFMVSAATFIFAFFSVSFIFFWSAVFVFLSSRNLKELKFSSIGKFQKYWIVKFCLAASFIAFSMLFIVHLLEAASLRTRFDVDRMPVSAISYMQENKITEKVFNDYAWGGFMLWQSPDIKVFIDGRMTGWRNERGEQVLADYLGIIEGKCDTLGKYEVEVVLSRRKDEFKCFENYIQVYEDDIAKVKVRKMETTLENR